MTTSTISTAADSANLFDRLRALLDACGSAANQHDRAIVGITACIDEGIDTRPRIIGVMQHLGFDRRHIALILNEGTGGDVNRHRWQRKEEGHYSLLN